MIDFLVHNQALIREWINGVGFILFFTLTCMITVFLWDTWVSRRFDYGALKSVEGVPVACALWWVFAAEAYRTCNVWLAYNQGKTGHHGMSIGVGVFASNNTLSASGYLFAGVVLCVGLIRAIYIFSPPDWKSRVWIYAMVGALIFVAVPTLFLH